jgi:hypothetical protein
VVVASVQDAFANTPIPAFPISDTAADTIALILWRAWERDQQAKQDGGGTDE